MKAAPLKWIERPDEAAVIMHPLRLRILSEMREPASPTEIAGRIGAPRQNVNYHVRELARAGFLSRAGRRRKRNMIEQRWVATARGYVLSPHILGAMGVTPEEVGEQWSAQRVLALAARTQSELIRALDDADGKRIATLSINSEIHFRTAAERKSFAEALEKAIVKVVAEHTSPTRTPVGRRAAGRPYRLVVSCYPMPPERSRRNEKASGTLHIRDHPHFGSG